MPILSAQWDIFSLIEHFASIQVAYKSNVKGVLEIHSNCPFCPGSEDSFIMRPETGEWNHHTRSGGCMRKGDCIDFLTSELVNMSRSEAMDFLGLEQSADFVPSERSQSAHVGNERPPCKQWQSQGMNLVERAQRYLWTSGGKDALAYLHARGLGDDIIKKKKLGYIPLQKNGKYYESELEQWGIDPATCKKDAVRIPPGILIPWFEGSTLWRLALKRIDKNEYGQVLGSGEGLFNVNTIQYGFPAMIVEGEICAMSVEQECGDLIACVATGSTTRGRLNRWIADLGLPLGESGKNGFVLQSFDEDESGDTGAEYWLGNLKKCIRWSPLVAKDPNDILLQKYFDGYEGYTLREWVEAGIESAKLEFGLSLPFVLPLQVGGIESVPTQPPCKVEAKQRRDFPIDLSKTKWHGPEVDLKELSLREHVEAYVAPISFADWKQRMI